MTAPGSGTATSGGGCTNETPCFVCQIKAEVRAQDLGSKWDDTPFAVNLVGVRLARSISDVFDDRMIAFFSLPADESSEALQAGGIEKDLVNDIVTAVGAFNGAHTEQRGHGVRRVPCSKVELEPGKPAAGHRVVAMFPITTDPGLVRPISAKKKLDDAIAASVARQKELEDAKSSFTDKLKKDLDAARDKLKPLPVPKKGEASTKERADAEAAVKLAQKAIDDLSVQVKWKPVTVERITAMIEAEKQNKAGLDAKLAKWSSTSLQGTEGGEFEGYKGAFLTDAGMEGDDHALFPVGFRADHFSLYLHHWSSGGAAPALTVGYFLGGRVLTGKTLKAVFTKLFGFPIALLLPRVKAESAAKTTALKAQCSAEASALKARKEAIPRGTPREEAARIAARNKKLDDDLLADQNKRWAELKAQIDLAEAVPTRELVPVTTVRKATGTPPVSVGAKVVQGCAVKTPAGSVPLVDDDEFDVAGHTRWTGREVRLHFHQLTTKPKGVKLDAVEIVLHHPTGDRPALPEGSKIVATEVMYEQGGKLMPIPDGDVLEVEGEIGGTNVHRGHNLDGSSGTVTANAESIGYVHNWSTGCQVFPFFVDFNFFILIAGLSKRWRCLRDAKAQRPDYGCTQLATGTATAPDPFVWEHAKISSGFPSKNLAARLKDDPAAIKKDLDKAEAGVRAKIDAWYKAHKTEVRAKEAAAAEQHVMAWYDAQVGGLDANIAAQKAIVAKLDAAGAAQSEADKAARTQADAAAQEADKQRAPLAKEQQDLKDAGAARAAVQRRSAAYTHVASLLHLGGGADGKQTPTYAELDTGITALCAKLDTEIPTLGDAPEAKQIAQDAKQEVQETQSHLKQQAWERAVKMKHDWMRQCDLGGDCVKKFSYTLMELAAGDATRDVRSLDHLDAEFTKKVSGTEVYPKWKGFGAA
jgi:hypothetical protein